MSMRIRNKDALLSTGNRRGREAMVQILEAGLQAADPYHNARRLVRLENGKLIVGNREFEPEGSPRTGEEVYDLSRVRKIIVVGAGKGIQNVARAFEEVLGDRLS